VATLSVLGCDPQVYYAGRAPLEAVARDIPVGPRDIVFRCNLVTVRDGLMHDFTAGHIDQSDAAAIIAALNTHLRSRSGRFLRGRAISPPDGAARRG
jgi:2,3-bisphosphoglycerate-independent phosphoglycerate mutase